MKLKLDALGCGCWKKNGYSLPKFDIGAMRAKTEDSALNGCTSARETYSALFPRHCASSSSKMVRPKPASSCARALTARSSIRHISPSII